jgi:hypothetical protein
MDFTFLTIFKAFNAGPEVDQPKITNLRLHVLTLHQQDQSRNEESSGKWWWDHSKNRNAKC